MKLRKSKNFKLSFYIYITIACLFVFKSTFSCSKINFKKKEIFIVNNKNFNFRFDVDVADTPSKRMAGLQCRKKINKNEGMLFIWNQEDSRNFWMKNTLFPIDVIFINKSKVIVDIFYNAKPLDLNLITSKKKAKYVLELNSGVLSSYKVKIGDKITFESDRVSLNNEDIFTLNN